MIGVNLGLPLCLVLMDGSETNFSGWRGAVDEARKGFKSNQRNLIKRFHTPVYRWRVSRWVESDKSLARWSQKPKIQILGHRWNAPVWQYIDPVGDAQGDQLRLVNSLISPRRLHAERGREWETIADEIVEDLVYAVVKAKRAAQAINKKFDDGAPVHWRELINLPMPQGIQMTFQDPNKQAVDAAKALAGGNSTLTK
jgi:capsid protein